LTAERRRRPKDRRQPTSNTILLRLVILLGVGFVCLCGVVGYGAWRFSVVSSQTQQTAITAKAYAARTRQLANTTQALVIAGRNQRISVDHETCRKVNELSSKLRAILIGSVIASRPFDRLYRQFGFPSYRVRLRMATREAASLSLVDCRPLSSRRSSKTAGR
jgi:hypothetical protein